MSQYDDVVRLSPSTSLEKPGLDVIALHDTGTTTIPVRQLESVTLALVRKWLAGAKVVAGPVSICQSVQN
jgi:hypothetical protein